MYERELGSLETKDFVSLITIMYLFENTIKLLLKFISKPENLINLYRIVRNVKADLREPLAKKVTSSAKAKLEIYLSSINGIKFQIPLINCFTCQT